MTQDQLLCFRNPLKRLRFNRARIKEIQEDQGFWLIQNTYFLKLKAPAIEFTHDLNTMKNQMRRALAFYKMNFDESIFEKLYNPSRRFDIDWDTNIKQLKLNYRQVYKNFVERTKS